MQMIAVLASTVLGAIAALHVYWGLGGVWPGTDPASCARAVAGFRGVDRMPPVGACLAVAAGLAAIAVLSLSLAGAVALPLPVSAVRGAVLLAGLVFVVRGAVGFTAAWRRMTPEMPFARNDVRWFSPLCLIVGAGLLGVALSG